MKLPDDRSGRAAVALRAARQTGGAIAASATYHLIGMTGLRQCGGCQGALAKARAAGYSDGRILRAD